MEEHSAQLVVTRGPQPGQKYPLAKGEMTIGRSTTNTIVISDPEVSRRHSRIFGGESAYAIEDWGSTNGTFINEQRVYGRMVLHHGDMIRLGETVFLTFVATAEEDQPVETVLPVDDEAAFEPDLTHFDAPALAAMSEVDPEPAAAEALPVAEHVPVAGQQYIEPAPAQGSSWRRWLIGGCGLLLLLACACSASLFFLDSYDGGRLLYCGPLQPLLALALSPFGFAPLC